MAKDKDPRPKRWRDAAARVTRAIAEGRQPDPADEQISKDEQEKWDKARAKP
jgi:hypothetical protein